MNKINNSLIASVLLTFYTIPVAAYPRPEKIKDYVDLAGRYDNMTQEEFNVDLFNDFALYIERVELLKEHKDADSISANKNRMKEKLLKDKIFLDTLKAYRTDLIEYGKNLRNYEALRPWAANAPSDKEKQTRLDEIKLKRNNSFQKVTEDYRQLHSRYKILR